MIYAQSAQNHVKQAHPAQPAATYGPNPPARIVNPPALYQVPVAPAQPGIADFNLTLSGEGFIMRSQLEGIRDHFS